MKVEISQKIEKQNNLNRRMDYHGGYRRKIFMAPSIK